MTTLYDARRSLLDALDALSIGPDLDSAFRHAQHAAFVILDLRGSRDPVTCYPQSVGEAVKAAVESSGPEHISTVLARALDGIATKQEG